MVQRQTAGTWRAWLCCCNQMCTKIVADELPAIIHWPSSTACMPWHCYGHLTLAIILVMVMDACEHFGSVPCQMALHLLLAKHRLPESRQMCGLRCLHYGSCCALLLCVGHRESCLVFRAAAAWCFVLELHQLFACCLSWIFTSHFVWQLEGEQQAALCVPAKHGLLAVPDACCLPAGQWLLQEALSQPCCCCLLPFELQLQAY